MAPSQDSSPRPVDRKSFALPIAQPRHLRRNVAGYFWAFCICRIVSEIDSANSHWESSVTAAEKVVFSTDINSGWWATSLPSEICAQSDQPHRKMSTSTDFRL